MIGQDSAEIAKLEALYAANPEGRIFTHLADAYRRAGDLDRALELVERGLIRHGEYASAHVVRGRILQALGEDAFAEEAFRQVLGLDPENRVALRTLADMARDAGERDTALRYYRELLALNRNDQEVRELIEGVEASAADEDAEGEEDPELPRELEVIAAESEAMAGLPDFEPLDLDGIGLDLGAYEVEGAISTEEVETEEVEAGELEIDIMGDHPGDGEVSMVDLPEEEMADEISAIGELPEIDSGIESGYDLGLVVTETMGDLYANQGLTERAAEVYRELLQSRPGDAALESKLASLSRVGSTPEEVLPEFEGAEDLAASDGPPVDDDLIEEPLVEELPMVPVMSTEGMAPGGRAIGEYLHRLLAFRAMSGILYLDESMVIEEAEVAVATEPAAVTEPVAAAEVGPLLLDESMVIEEGGLSASSDSDREPAPPGADGSQGGESGEDEDAEDLEVFRSWLRSLKG